jgi:predicted cupin superfamily sugar epimerase
MLTPDEIRKRLGLQPLPAEGGDFRETYRSTLPLHTPAGGERSAATAIYFLLAPGVFSALHRLSGDEIFHFYLGDPVEMLQLWPDGSFRTVVIGSDVAAGMEPQLVVPGGVWQGCRLRDGGHLALMGTTMSPGFDPADFEPGVRASLLSEFPGARDAIMKLTRE